MNCTTCGTALVPGALFCPNCGSRVTAPSSAGAPTIGLPPTYGEPGPPLSQPYDDARRRLLRRNGLRLAVRPMAWPARRIARRQWSAWSSAFLPGFFCR